MAKLRRLREYSPRDLLIVGLPLLLVVLACFWLASRYIRPAPPDTLILATGGEGGAYQRYAAAYKDALARYGIRVIEEPSAGSTENLDRLRNDDLAVDAAFIQGGTARVQEDDRLVALGGLYYEPLWIFYREDADTGHALTRITELKGRRVAIGASGSGTRHLALEILNANQFDETSLRLVDLGGLDLAPAFAKQRIDAAFVVGPPQSAAVWALLHTPGVRLMNLAHAEAYTRRLPFLTKLTLPRGAINVAADMPPRDIQMVATTATLVVREDTHPALIDLLMQTLQEVHGGADTFQKPGDFPRPAGADFPLSPEAARYYKSGKPFLQRYLPFWAATLIDRMVVMLIPLFAVLIPVMRFAPGIYNWRIKSRIYQRYGELKFIEAELEANPSRHPRADWLRRVDAIEREVNHLPMPLAFADMVYTMRSHIDLVRAAIDKKTTSA